MRTTLRFGLIAAGLGWLVFQARSPLAFAIFAHALLAFVAVTAAYAGFGPRVYGKSADTGRIPWVFWLALLPVHGLNALAFQLVRRLSDENVYDEVLPGIFLGRRVVRGEESCLSGVAAVLDVTSEFQDTAPVRALPYKAIPVLDDGAPTSAQLQEGVAWLIAAPRPAYVHCALGHGRSATFVAAFALATGAAADIASAEAALRAKRPGVRLNTAQRASLAALLPQPAPAR